MPVSPSEIAEYDILLVALDQTRKVNYSTCKSILSSFEYSHSNIPTTVAALTILASEICTTFPSEVKHIWRRVLYDDKSELVYLSPASHSSKWTLPKVFYLIARYYSFIYLV